ncbi:MAG: EAL domain-containing protein [Lachnospiraceae bacterium]|nr:EAL domain-containing protein [Lachnospiraceae bacterium]
MVEKDTHQEVDKEISELQQDYGKFQDMNDEVRPFYATLRLFLIYVIFGCLWILTSDRVLSWIVGTGERYIQFQSYKGWFYVGVSGILFSLFIFRTLKLYKQAIVSVLKGYEELSATYEELYAMNQELDSQNSRLESQKEALLISEQRYQLAIEGSKDGIWEWDIVNDVYYLSDRWKEMYGSGKNKFDSGIKSLGVLMYPGDWDVTMNTLHRYLDSKQGIYESSYRVINRQGEVRWILSRGKGYWDEEGNPIRIIGSHSDMTEFFEMEEQLKRLAYHDSLTDLPNRNHIEKKIKEMIHLDVPFALMVMDIDDFKTINDMYGHAIGDIYINHIASLLKKNIAEKEMPARISGGQFAVLIESDKEEEICERVRKILTLMKTPWEMKEQSYFGSCSAGVAYFPRHATEYSLLLQAAEIAMFQQKEKGKGSFSIFESVMYDNSLKMMEMRSELRQAVEQDQFMLHYQPQYDLTTGEMTGMEALIRWRHPVKGFISPMEFIPFSEKTGHITPISEWVLRTAVEQKRKWEEQGYRPAKMAVNLSGYVITDEESLKQICDLIEELQIKDGELEIEVTETAVMLQLDQAKESLEKLRNSGITIAMDDFGTGYSSLTYLHTLPFDIVKIDRDFIRNISSSEDESFLYTTVIDLAHNMNLTVVAEGVETEEQKEFLIRNNCDVGQGYYFSRPVPAEEIEKILKEACECKN